MHGITIRTGDDAPLRSIIKPVGVVLHNTKGDWHVPNGREFPGSIHLPSFEIRSNFFVYGLEQGDCGNGDDMTFLNLCPWI